MPPKKLNNYKVLNLLGKGGMATVYRAVDTDTGRVCAIKVFYTTENRPPEMTKRLRDREVRMLVSVQHPNIVRFYESCSQDDQYYYTMEFVEDSLQRRMKHCARDDILLRDRVHLIRQTCDALVAIHHQGIVHRDVKPGNILLDEDPSGALHVKLTDLGIAKTVSETDVIRDNAPTKVPGTAKYLPPEQIRLEPVDGRADIFSLGVVAYELLTGQAPFTAEDSKGFLAANRKQRQTPAIEVTPELPKFLSDIVERMLAKDREERYDSETLSRDLQLASQHIMSGAELADHTNPGSMFYAPLPGHAGPGGTSRPILRLSVETRVMAASIVVAGIAATGLLWPAGPDPGSAGNEQGNVPVVEPVTLPPVTAGGRLRQAKKAHEARQWWQTWALLGNIERAELSNPEKSQYETLSEKLRRPLARELFASGQLMVGRCNLNEAAAMVEALERYAPGEPEIAQLRDAITEARRQAADTSAWGRALKQAGALAAARKYPQAVVAYGKLAKDYAGDADRAALAERRAQELLDDWASVVLKANARAAQINDFLKFRASAANPLPGYPDDKVPARMYLKLARDAAARLKQKPALYAEILRNCRLAVKGGDAGTARSATDLMDQTVEWKRTRDSKTMFVRMEKEGFAADFWRPFKRGNATRAVSKKGVLSLGLPAAGGTLVGVDTSELPHEGAFELGVSICGAGLGDGTLGGRAGIQIVSSTGHQYAALFDGNSYCFDLNGTHVPVLKATPHKKNEWHKLSLVYDNDKRRLAMLVDGKELRTFAVNLGKTSLRVRLEGSGRAAVGADLRGIYFKKK